MDWEIRRHVVGEWHYYQLVLGRKLAATAKWRVLGINAELHSRIIYKSKSVVAKTKVIFDEIKQSIKESGCEKIVVLSDSFTDLMGKYWRYMGFRFFGQYPSDNGIIHYAVMEV